MDLPRRFQDKPKLLEVASKYRSRKCHNARDKIYGLLALTGDELIRADYGVTTEKAYTNLLMASIQNTKFLDVLSYKHGLKSVTSNLPSFVPDWSITSKPDDDDLRLCNRTITVCRKLYAASDRSQAQFNLVSPTQAATKGIAFDSIAQRAQQFDHEIWQALIERT
jgi:hypothetical protein